MSKQTELAQVADTITVNSGNVGIGTSSPATNLEISDTLDATIRLESTENKAVYTANSDTYGKIEFYSNDASGGGAGIKNAIRSYVANTAGGQSALAFSVSNGSSNDVEAMRIDASGNLLVGQSSTTVPGAGNTTAGTSIRGTDGVFISRTTSDTSASALQVNKNTGQGAIINIASGGTTVGSIGTNGGRPYFYGGSGLKMGLNAIQPCNSNGSNSDNDQDLGSATVRFDDVYATNGTIQTSDRNEKQDIAELTDAEQRVAVAAKGLLRKFRWRDAVEAKGDEARTHFGIIAQDLQAAFVAEGLDAGDYAMFISTTWWETQTEVPAVEAVAEVLDEEGNVVTEAVEAADAYTRTDTYDTQEEAPEGATERTRLGVRYSELLAFIIGAL